MNDLSAPANLPLKGKTVIEFCHVVMGPSCGMILAELGAEVIKIESRARLDHSRVHSLTAGTMQGGIDESPVFNDLNLGKHSLTLNLRTAEGRGLVRDLVGLVLRPIIHNQHFV